MESAAVFLVGVAIVVLVFWLVQNDRSPSIRDQRGLFRMRPPAQPAPEEKAATGDAAAEETRAAVEVGKTR
jgi:hypothetical protein